MQVTRWESDSGSALLTHQERTDAEGCLAAYTVDDHFMGIFTEEQLQKVGYKKVEEE